MSGMKSLAKDTAIYGLSSILGRFLNWCFVFLYINALKTTAEYGIVTNLYAYMKPDFFVLPMIRSIKTLLKYILPD